ncbi:MAG: sensor histidine kinase [Anaerolineales bacterium]|jgi:signal transduction histidine kinase
MDQLTFFVFFIYGLAFFGMGITMALESGRTPALAQARALRSLAAFGLIHGTHEWLESYIIQARSFGTALPDWLPWLRLFLLITSFASLFIYGLLMTPLISASIRGRKILHLNLLGLYALTILIGITNAYYKNPIPAPLLVDELTRYLLAVPSGMLATMALRAQGQSAGENSRAVISHSLRVAAFGFSIYTLTQFFVPPIDMFPARYINEEAFRMLTGFPIQLVRTLMAILITYGLLRASQAMEKERQTQQLAIQQSRLEALEKQEEIRRELLRHTVQAQEDERARIARELHDETSQVLTAFTLELATLRELTLQKPKVKNIVDKLQELSKQMSQSLYAMVHDLRPAQLDDLGLVPALQSLLDSEYGPKGLQIEFEVTGSKNRLDSLIETVLYRVTQEALTNVTRHAEVNEASLQLDYAEDAVTLRVQDAGKGFDPNEPLHPPRGWGLEGMRERVESVGGQLILKSATRNGTTVEVNVPIVRSSEEGG